jgi:hypothetical protein
MMILREITSNSLLLGEIKSTKISITNSKVNTKRRMTTTMKKKVRRVNSG